MRFKKYIFSPVEIEFLSNNKSLPINQLAIAVAKPIATVKRKLAELSGEIDPVTITKNKISYIGKRPDCDNLFFRSRWESNVYRWLRTHPNIKIEYEPQTFSFSPFGILSGTVSYTPDFRITVGSKTLWIEVKGQMKPQDKTKIRRFKKYYPEEFKNLVAITGGPKTKATGFFQGLEIPIHAYYNDINRVCKKTIEGWE